MACRLLDFKGLNDSGTSGLQCIWGSAVVLALLPAPKDYQDPPKP